MSLNEIKELYLECQKDIVKITRKKELYNLDDLENVMKTKFNAFRIELSDINLIMKKKYKLYSKKANTPRIISEEMIRDEEYVATYVIYNDDIKNALKDKENIYIHRAFMVASRNDNLLCSFASFNLTKEMSIYLEILCNHSLEELLRRLK